MADGLRGLALELAAGGDVQLQLDQVQAGDGLGDRVLDLQARVDLHEGEALLGRLVEELDRARVAVAGLEREAPRGLLDLLLLLAREHDGRGLLDDLLVAALARAVAHARRPGLTLAVGDQLHLDVVRVADHRLHEDRAVAERVGGLAARRRQRVLEAVELGDLADAATAAAGGRLDHQREADALGVLARFLDRLDRPVGPGRDGHAGLLGHQLGLDLVAQRAHHVAGRADEDEAHLLDHVRERGVLGHEAPAGPDGVRLGRDQGLLEALVVQVRAGPLAVVVDGRGRAEVVGLVGVADEHRAALRLGVERDDADRIVGALGVELADGMDETHRGLAAIDDGETTKRALGHRRHGWHVRAWRCIPDGWSSCNPPRGGRP